MKSDNLKEKSGFATNPVKQILSHSFINLFILWGMGIIWIFLSLIMPDQVGKITKLFSSGKEVTWNLVGHRIFLMITAQFALSITVYLRGRMLDHLQEGTFRSLVLDMFRRILRFKGSFFRDNEIEKINVRMFDDSKIFSTFYSSLLGDISIEIVCVIIFSYIMISTHWLLGVTIITISFLLGYVILFDGKIQETTKKVQQNWEKARIDSSELLSCIQEIRNNSIFEYGELKFKKTLDKLYNVKIDCSKLTSLFTAMGPMVRNIQMAGLFTVGACLCLGSNLLSDLTGKIQWGDVIQFSIMAQIFQVRFSRIADFFIQWRLANQSIIRVKEYLGQPCSFINFSENPPPLPVKKNISFQDVSLSHGGSVKILDKINLHISEGVHAAFVGPSGSGKSTLISLIGRDNEPSSGQVRIGDEPVQNYNIQSLGKETGNVSQKSFILNTSIRNNLLLGLRHSSGQLKDEEGPVEKLNIKTMDELNDKLIETIRLTGLEDDIFEKFLACPLPEKLPFSGEYRNKITDVRKEITEKILKTDENLIIKFDCNHIIQGTVFENILGPGFSMKKDFDLCRPLLYEILEENNLHEALALAGSNIFMAESNLPEAVICSLRNVCDHLFY
ncbi:MAG: ABC transporter ATP-binding protein, partial [Candidatus Eremiobacterota bacterium]